MMKLLAALSNWRGPKNRQGLTLELSIHSQSDNEHYFNDIMTSDTFPFKHPGDEDVSSGGKSIIRQFYKAEILKRGPSGPLVSGHRPTSPDDTIVDPEAWITPKPPIALNAMKRYFGAPVDFHSCHLPQAKVVNAVLTRYRYKRQLSPNALAKLFKESLICSKSLVLERFIRFTASEEKEFLEGAYYPPLGCDRHEKRLMSFQLGFYNTVLPALPKTLEKLVCFSVPFKTRPVIPKICISPQTIHRRIAGRLKELVWTYPGTEAFDLASALVFRSGPAAQKWVKLENVCIRDARLAPRESPHNDTTDRLLLRAARMASRMPELKCMEIWTSKTDVKTPPRKGFPNLVCVFRYSVKENQPSLFWTSDRRGFLDGYDYPRLINGPIFSPRVIRRWKKVAAMNPLHSDLTVKVERKKKYHSKCIVRNLQLELSSGLSRVLTYLPS
jgi:hypothetical protein